MTLAPDTVLNERYRISYLVDERRYTPLYRAYDTQAGRRVLLGGFDGSQYDPQQTAALAQQLYDLPAEGMLPLLDHFAVGDNYYLVAEDPGGQDLDRLLRDQGGPLSEQAMLTQARNMLLALEKAHNLRPSAHIGDLRSSDVWASTDKELRLTPFAFVSQVGSGPSPYRAPELLQHEHEPNETSDLYALGAVLYQLATGWSPPNVQQRQAGAALVPPRQLNGQLSALAERAIIRALELKTANRYHRASEMRQSIEMVQLMGGRSLGGEPDGGTQTAPVHTGAMGGSQSIGAPTVPLMPQPQQAPQQGQPAWQPAPVGPPPPPPPFGGTAPYAPTAPSTERRGLSGCWIAAIVAFIVVLAATCLFSLLLVFGPLRPAFEALLGAVVGGAASATAPAATTPNSAATTLPTVAPAAPTEAAAVLPPLGPNAIALDNVAALTETEELTTTTLGLAAYSPDGERIAVALDNGIRVYATSDFAPLAEMTGEHPVSSLAWSPDGLQIASGSLNTNEIRIWNAGSGRQVRTLEGHTRYIRSLAWSPDGQGIASGSADQTIKLWAASSGRLLRTLEGHADLLGGVAFSPDNTTLASASRDGTVRLWDVATGEATGWSYTAPSNPETGAPYWTTGVAWSPDGTTLAAGAIDGVARIFALPDTTPRHELQGHTDWVVIRGVAFSPDGQTLATGSVDSTVRLWSVATGAEQAVLAGHQLQVLSVAWHPDGEQLVSTSDQDGKLLLWNTRETTPRETLQFGDGVITTIAYSPDSRKLGTASVGGVVRVRDLAGGPPQELQGTLPSGQGLTFVGDERLAALSDQGEVVLWNLNSGRQEQSLTGGATAAISVAASGDGALLAAGYSDGTITVWSLANGAVLQQITGMGGGIVRLAWNSDGSLLAAHGREGTGAVAVWEVRSGELLHTFEHVAPPTTLAFVPASDKLAVADRSGALIFYEARGGQELGRIAAEQGWFTTLAFNPNGSLVAAGGVDGIIAMYATADYRLMHGVDTRQNILTLAFRPDGEQLAYSGRDGAVRLLELQQ